MRKVKVIFQPSGRRGEVKAGLSIVEASRELGVDIENLCGGKGVCGKCKVRIEEGYFEKFGIQSSRSHVSPWQEAEAKVIDADLAREGYRLGCFAEIQGDVLVFVPEESRAGKQVVSKAARDIPIEQNPAVKLYYVELKRPSFEEPTADFERLCKVLQAQFGLENLKIDFYVLRELSDILRQGKWKVTVSVWMDREIIRIRPGKLENHYGVAIDVGTTTVAGYLCDLSTMYPIDTQSLMNPQCKYGEDVMSRITYATMNPGGLQEMSNDIIEGLNRLLRATTRSTHPPAENGQSENQQYESTQEQSDVRGEIQEAEYLGLEVEDIEDIVIVGNTAMHHILLQLNPQYLGVSPFAPAVHGGLDIKARNLGLTINNGSYVHILPNMAGFVGADNVGVLLVETPYKSSKLQLIIDIGTNGELVLGNKDKLISSSCATGPALEGAQLMFGMRAAPGAIERVRINPDTHEVDYKVIGRDAWKSYSAPDDMQTKGICGSGILDLFAELYLAGIISRHGTFNKNQISNRFRRNPKSGILEFVIAWKEETSIDKDVVITQKDIRQVQLAKGALYAGCKLLMNRMGVDQVDRVRIAGAFGTHVDPAKAIIMGLFPSCAVQKVASVGNAAGDGARAALLNREKRLEGDWVSRNVEYIELTLENDFEKEFMDAMQIPHASDEFAHLEELIRPEILHQK